MSSLGVVTALTSCPDTSTDGGRSESTLLSPRRVVTVVSDVVPPEVESLLTADPVVAHLATCVDGHPHSAPLWFRYADGAVEVLTTGRKLANVRRNPRVSISMERDQGGIPEWMVTIRGTATVIDDEDEIEAANRRINRRYGVDDDAWSENVLVRIDVESVAYRTY